MKQFFYFWLGLLSLLIVSASYAEDQEMHWKPARPFSAELVESNRHNQKLQKKSRVQMGEGGLFVTKLAPDGDRPVFLYIQNFKTQRGWVASPGKQYYAQLPIEDDMQASKPGGKANDENDDAELSMGVLVSEPCLGMEKRKRGERDLKGTKLTVWECTSVNSKKKYLQHYSTLLGVVIRQESSEGHILELKDIKLDLPGAVEFSPPKLWREVTLEEFFTGASMLPSYEEEEKK